MDAKINKWIFWTPRILTIVLIVFLALFALDVFVEGYGFWETLQALFMHLIPNFVLIGVLILSWKREWIAAIFFPSLAIFYIVWTGLKMHWTAYVTISGSLIIIGILFFINFYLKRKIKKPGKD